VGGQSIRKIRGGGTTYDSALVLTGVEAVSRRAAGKLRTYFPRGVSSGDRNDVRTWTGFYRDKNGRQKRPTLGRYDLGPTRKSSRSCDPGVTQVSFKDPSTGDQSEFAVRTEAGDRLERVTC
jgi:hypothetical protein